MNTQTEALIDRFVAQHPNLLPCRTAPAVSVRLLGHCFRQGGKTLICGNGGSAADSEHVVGELMRSFRLRRPLRPDQVVAHVGHVPEGGAALAQKLQGALPAISLVSHSSLTSAVANDIGSDMVFALQVFGYGRRRDVLISISRSGKAVNALNAVKLAKTIGLRSLALTGECGDLRDLCDTAIMAPGSDTAAIQENHMHLYHALCGAVEQELFPE